MNAYLQASIKDLINKIGAIEAFGGMVSATLGGTEADPTMTTISPPSAWVLFVGSQTNSQDRERWTQLRHNFDVHLSLRYGQEDDFTEQQMSLIEQIGQAVTGSKIEALAPKNILWAFDGINVLAVETDVIRYTMSFSCPAFYTQST